MVNILEVFLKNFNDFFTLCVKFLELHSEKTSIKKNKYEIFVKKINNANQNEAIFSTGRI